jgi:DNA modification methylase
LVHSDYHYRHEPILYGWTPGQGRPGRGKHSGTRWYGDNASDTVFEFKRPRSSQHHPTVKPTGLVEAHLLNSSKVGDYVYDPFAGSGTTLIACEALKRRAVCMEIDPAYVDVIRQRYADYTSQPELAP